VNTPDLLAEFLVGHDINARSYGESNGWLGHHIDISWSKGRRNYAIRLDVKGLEIKCDSMFSAMRHMPLERSRMLNKAAINLADPNSLGKILDAVLKCTIGNCTECVFTK
jgi:hypothetical protein